MKTEEKVLLSTKRAAAALDISRTTLYWLMRNGSVKYVQIGSDRRIPVEEVHRIAREGCPKITRG